MAFSASLVTGNTFSNGDSATAAKLNAQVNAATFATTTASTLIGFDGSKNPVDYALSGTGAVLPTTVNPVFTGEAVTVVHQYGSGATPTYTLGSSAGAGATCNIVGNDLCGNITVVTAGSPATANNIVTVNFAVAYTTAPVSVTLTPANQTAGSLYSSANCWQVNSLTTAHFIITAVGTPNTGSTFVWNYRVN